MLAAEAAFLLLLLRRRDETVRAGFASGRSPGGIATALSGSIASGILQGRSLAAAAALSRTRSEATALGLAIVGGATRGADAARDLFAARRAAESYARRWLGLARVNPITASAESEGSLRRIGVTENSDAYNRTRTTAARGIVSDVVGRVWDAELDRRVCPRCSAADGTIVGLRESFPLGEPGSVHPFCRCTWALVTITQTPKEAA